MLVAGVLSTLTGFPSNVIIKRGDDVSMECSTNVTSGDNPRVTWRHDNERVVSGQCVVPPSFSSRFTSRSVTANTCEITGLGSSSVGNQGPYECDDASFPTGQAIAVLIGMQFSCCDT